ncbi:unnamed protein product (macronuclear) [Paramecium tetraurelia]|uniref:Uncharacterized protein n=1 Tax=Paramecium tetraurelia TaxID=5888 RepID=A0DM33_PARTE|nr:uncharacterized protein GSPATT00018318001 [Paramecium tetraurelia]CAK84100.1 unnamed protein product [Paramecium tetraurelia]|eukprot:XP_001451497.1 hypothetical protein (macronuclear) [Paramecium tetraurelia strain d4-2]
MQKSLSASILILLIVGQVQCGLWQTIVESTVVSGVTTATIAIGAKVGLAAAGFSSVGPVAGSFAAATQAGVGNVVAGSLFSIAQSAAMTGVVSAAIVPASAIGAVVGVGYLATKLM